MGKIILTLALVAGGFFANHQHQVAVLRAFDHGYDSGGAYERALEGQCRKEVGDSYDKMVFCIEGYYGTEKAEELAIEEYPEYKDSGMFERGP